MIRAVGLAVAVALAATCAWADDDDDDDGYQTGQGLHSGPDLALLIGA